MNVSAGNSKEIFELFTNAFWVRVARMKLLILTRRLLIRSAFREKCIFIDYDQDYNKRVFVLHFFISLSDNLKLSIDIFIRSVRHVFAQLRFIFVKRSRSRRDGRKRIMFSLFYKSTSCWYCECTQIKVDPLQFRMMYYSYLYQKKMMS